MSFADVIASWKAFGFFDIFLPFALMFAIFYGILSKSKIFGDPEKDRKVNNINLIVSLSAALFVMGFGASLGPFLGIFFTQTMVILLALLSFMMVLYMVMPAVGIDALLKEPQKYAKYVVPIAIALIVFIFIAAGGLKLFGLEQSMPVVFGTPTGISGIFSSLSSSDTVTIVLILIFVGVVWFLTREEGGNKDDKNNPVVFVDPETGRPIRRDEWRKIRGIKDGE
jgi:hypothetical protein